jgi:hypothetical protein
VTEDTEWRNEDPNVLKRKSPRKLGSWISVNSILSTAIGELRRTPTLRLPMSLARQGAVPKPCFFARSSLLCVLTTHHRTTCYGQSQLHQWSRCRCQPPVVATGINVGYAMLLKIGKVVSVDGPSRHIEMARG